MKMDADVQRMQRGKMWGRQSVGQNRMSTTDDSGKFLPSYPATVDFLDASSESDESSRQIVGSTL
jgi:hypothetical protein